MIINTSSSPRYHHEDGRPYIVDIFVDGVRLTRVSNGQPISSRLGSTAVNIEPGEHRVELRTRDGEVVEAETVTVVEPPRVAKIKRCKRCGGRGELVHYRHVEGGQCFRCHGTGRDPGGSGCRLA